MGILDDAIREHLELKRKHGAQEDEVQILEQEAFGPPSRPGEPDFPERPPTGEQAVVEEEAPTGAEDLAASEAPPAAEEPAVADAPEAPEEPPVAAAEPAADAPEAELPGAFYDQASERSVAEEPTVEHPPPPPPEDEVEVEEPPVASEDSGEFEIGEIELELDDEFEEFREVEEEPAAESELGAPFSDESAEYEAIEPEPEPEPEPEAEAAEPEAAPAEEGEDVLEETPEFLRDTPEDERLWFEQGAPQDFDFDEDEGDDAEDEGR
jgi:hypothetical protein